MMKANNENELLDILRIFAQESVKKAKSSLNENVDPIQKKYLEGLTGAKRTARANLIKSMDKLYKSGARIPRSMFKARVR